MEIITKKDLEEILTMARNDLLQVLTDGNNDVDAIAIKREIFSIMSRQWNSSKLSQQHVNLIYGGVAASAYEKQQKLVSWWKDASKQANDLLRYEFSSEQRLTRYLNKMVQHHNFVQRWVDAQDNFFTYIKDNHTGIVTIYEANKNTPVLTASVKAEFLDWFKRQFVTEALLQQSSEAAMADFLRERSDVRMLIMTVEKLLPHKTVYQEDIERPVYVEAIELGLSFVPVVGSMVAMYESVAGEDLFGYKLSNVERAVIGASVLLPLAGRLVKGGRAAYTQARLMKLYGRPEEVWGRVIRSSVRASEEQGALRTIKKGEEVILKGSRLEAAAAKEATEAVAKVVKPTQAVAAEVSQEVKALWTTVSKEHTVLKVLDEVSIDRALRVGPETDKIAGQLLEEFAESHLVPMLGKRNAAQALGLNVPKGAVLQHIPGHSILGADKRKLTDGLIGYFKGDDFHILAVIEAKSGRTGPRELLFGKKKTLEQMTKVERKELRAYAKDLWRDAKDIVEAQGKGTVPSIEQIEIDLLKSKSSGQLASDIERLSEGARIFIDKSERTIHFSPKDVKFFGVVTKGVRTNLLETKARAAGFNFEAIAVPVHRKELKQIAEKLLPVAEAMVEKAP